MWSTSQTSAGLVLIFVGRAACSTTHLALNTTRTGGQPLQGKLLLLVVIVSAVAVLAICCSCLLLAVRRLFRRSRKNTKEIELLDKLIDEVDAEQRQEDDDNDDDEQARDHDVRLTAADLVDDDDNDDNVDAGTAAQSGKCTICHDRMQSTAFVPCGHRVCFTCAATFISVLESPVCHLCKQDIRSLERL